MAVIITLEPTAGSRPSFTMTIGIIVIQPPGDGPHNPAPHQTVNQRNAHFTQDQKGKAAGLDLLQRHRPNDHGDRLVAGVAADAGDDRHQRGQRHQL